jgi:hypothetical protein
MTLTGDWEKAFRLLSALPQRLKTTLNQGVLEEAHRIRDDIVKGIHRGAPGGKRFAPHSPLTLAVRKMRRFGGSKVMIQSAALVNSVAVIPVRPGVAFVGVRRKAKSGANIAHIHEFGRTFTVPFTSRMARFLFAAMKRAGIPPRPRAKGSKGAGSITIRIPARPYIGPVVKNLDRAAIRARFEARIRAVLRP